MALPAPLFSSVCGNPAFWDGPCPDCNAAMTLLGPSSSADKDEVAQTHIDVAQRHPVTIAFVAANDPNNICVGHAVSRFPSDLTTTRNIDGKLCCHIRDHADAALAAAFETDGFVRLKQKHYLHADLIRQHQNGTPPELRRGPHAASSNADALRLRAVTLLPFAAAGDFLDTNPDGVHSLSQFYEEFIKPALDSGDADKIADYTHLETWWRGA